MQNGSFSDYRVHKWLTDMGTIWVALHYDDPTIAGAYASEVFGGSYQRVRVEFSEPVNRVIFNSQDVTFKGLPTIRITHLVGWDNQYSGNMEFSVPLPEAINVLAGKSFRIPTETLAISLP